MKLIECSCRYEQKQSKVSRGELQEAEPGGASEAQGGSSEAHESSGAGAAATSTNLQVAAAEEGDSSAGRKSRGRIFERDSMEATGIYLHRQVPEILGQLVDAANSANIPPARPFVRSRTARAPFSRPEARE